jgi:arylsulfatase A-like enzyme
MKYHTKLIAFLAIIVGILIIVNTLYKNSVKESKYNIILITVDSLRADHLPCYGYGRNTAPNICSLAKEGVLFKNAYSQGTQTYTSLSSLIFSKFPPSHGVYNFNDALPKDQSTFIEVLKENNYSISIMSSHTNLLHQIYYKFPFKIYYSSDYVYFVDDLATNIKLQKPFFIWTHLMDIHFPYNQTQRSRTYYANSPLNNTDIIDIIQKSEDLGTFPNVSISEEEISYLKDMYDESLIEADSYIGNIVEILKKTGIYDNTLIIISADHGEGFGEHGIFFHGGKPYNVLDHVPLIIKFPKNMYAGKTVEQVVRHVDIAPKIFDLLGLRSDMKMQGVSLIPAIEGSDLNQIIYSEGENSIAYGNKSYKYIYNLLFGKDELYDLEKDPGEKHNLIDENPELSKEFRTKLLSFVNSLEKVKTEKIVLSEELIRELRSLGYVQ